ncbi:MAG: 50S ribosomal protein L22 [bacterium]
MQVKASIKNLRISPKKVRLVVNLVKGMDAQEAQKQLSFLNKRSAKDVLKLLNSAIANGENNFGLQKSNLFIKEIRVDGGITIKRWTQRAFGRAAMIRKKASHINLVLDEKVPTKLKNIKKAEKVATDSPKSSEIKEKDIKGEGGSVVSSAKDKKLFDRESKGHWANKGFKKKVFQRKSG